jgi:hypothetical protein
MNSWFQSRLFLRVASIGHRNISTEGVCRNLQILFIGLTASFSTGVRLLVFCLTFYESGRGDVFV